jgi:uncharacterized protein (TIGR01655 family)
MKKTVISILVALVIVSGIYIVFKRDFDQFNPLYKQEVVYVMVSKPGEVEVRNSNTRYRYNLAGYTEQGQRKKITFSSSTDLELGTYVKVVAKGAYTKKWTLVKQEDIPNESLKKVLAK